MHFINKPGMKDSCLFIVLGGIDSLMCRVDDVTVKPSGVSRLNLTMCGMKLCRMVGLKEVRSSILLL